MSKHTSLPPTEERDLVRRAQVGDNEALGILFEKYRLKSTRTAFCILNNSEEAKDAAQSTFLKMVEKIKTFKGDSGFYTWITRIAINVSLMQKRSWWAHHIQTESALPESWGRVYASRSTRDRVLDNMPEMIDLERCVKMFTPEERELFGDFLEEKSRSVRGMGKSSLIICVLRAMRKLKPKDRAVIALRYFGEKTIKEIAREEKISIPVIKTRSLRAHHTLRKFVAALAH